AAAQVAHGARPPELGIPVALDGAARYHLTAPVLHHAETVEQDGVGRVGAGQVGTAVGALVAQRLDDGDHPVQGLVDVPEEIVGRDHGRNLPSPAHGGTCPQNRPGGGGGSARRCGWQAGSTTSVSWPGWRSSWCETAAGSCRWSWRTPACGRS